MEDMKTYKQLALEMFERAKIVLTDKEKANIKYSDFGLKRFKEIGVQFIGYVDTERVSAKDIYLMPGQTVPEHKHPTLGNKVGKEETFRCRYGMLYLYVEGDKSDRIDAGLSEDLEEHFTVWRQIILSPGEQYRIAPDTLHWFQGGPDGCIMSEFATEGTDDIDIFTMPNLKF